MELVVLAKAPVPGRVKTRLCPPCTPAEAAAVAEAALVDTLRAALASAADRVVVALDGAPGPWCPGGVEVEPQGAGTLADRLERVWAARRGPCVLIGMDTPQVPVGLLDRAIAGVRDGDPAQAALGLADDGGWWLLGAGQPRAGTFAGIPTSRSDTGRRQLARLRAQGCRVARLPRLTDVDRFGDAVRVAATVPGSRFAAAVASVTAAAEARR